MSDLQYRAVYRFSNGTIHEEIFSAKNGFVAKNIANGKYPNAKSVQVLPYHAARRPTKTTAPSFQQQARVSEVRGSDSAPPATIGGSAKQFVKRGVYELNEGNIAAGLGLLGGAGIRVLGRSIITAFGKSPGVVAIAPGDVNAGAAPPEGTSEGAMEEISSLLNAGEYAKAVGKLDVLADAGMPEAQCLLGVLYENGTGVPQNFVFAHICYNIAASSGLEDATERRDAISGRMSAEQIAEAQAGAIERFSVENYEEDANEEGDQSDEGENRVLNAVSGIVGFFVIVGIIALVIWLAK